MPHRAYHIPESIDQMAAYEPPKNISPGAFLARSALKLTMGLAPYAGEIAWQVAGSPGRDSFELLEHVGNLGVGFGGTVLALSAIESTVKIGAFHDDPNPVHRYEQWKQVHKYFLVSATLIGIAAQGYSETLFPHSTHDILDFIYGASSVLLASYLYDRVEQRNISDWKPVRLLPMAQIEEDSSTALKSDNADIKRMAASAQRSPLERGRKAKAKQRRKVHKQSRKRNRK